MKKHFYLIFVYFSLSFTLSSSLLSAQSNYFRTVLEGETYTAIAGGNVINAYSQLAQSQDTSADDGTVLVTLPFTFTYYGQNYTQATFCTNGWVAMGNQTSVTSLQSRLGNNLFTTSAPKNLIAAWYKDGFANFPSPGIGSMVHGDVSGVYIFEWRNVAGTGLSLTTTNTINYMVKLYGPASPFPGRIEILYGSQAGSFSTLGASIGIKDSIGGSGNHYINALNGSSTSGATASSWPGNGRGYRFDPLLPCTGTPIGGTTAATDSSVCAGGSVTLYVQDATVATGLTYEWLVSYDNVTWSAVPGASNDSITTGPLFTSRSYQLRIGCGSNSATSVPLLININSPSVCPPSNDEPCGAIQLNLSSDTNCTNAVTGTTAFATQSTGYGYTNPLECGVANQPKDVWYKVTTTASGQGSTILHFRLTRPAGSTMTTANMILLKPNGTCPNLTFNLISGVCRNSGPNYTSIEMTAQFLTPNTTYYLRVNPVSNNDATGTFQVCAFLPIPVPPCTQLISPAPNAANVPVNEFVTFQWASAPGATLYDLHIGTTISSLPTVNQGTATSDSSRFLAYSKKYYWYVAPRNSSGAAVGCPVDSFTTERAPLFCVPLTTNNCSTNDTLKQIQINGEFGTAINNITGCSPGGYSDYTTLDTLVIAEGKAYSGIYHASFVHNYLTVWIDFNDDSVFTSSEIILSNLKQQWSGLPTPLSVNIPPGSALGTHRLRARNVYYAVNPNVVQSITDACNNYTYSETEDYTVTIVPLASVPRPEVAAAVVSSCVQAGNVSIDPATNNTSQLIDVVDSDNNLVASLNANGNDLGNVRVDVFKNVGPIRTSAEGIRLLDRTIVIRPQFQPTSAVTVRLYFTAAELSALQAADPTVGGINTLMVTKTPDSCNGLLPTNGTQINQTASGSYDADYYIDVTVNSFSSYYIHGNAGVVPVTMIDFTGRKKGAANELTWKTASESNNRGFRLLRSIDGINFSSKEFIPSKAVDGNSASLITYSFTDNSPFKGNNYYRLAQIDLDNRSTLSNILLLKGASASELIISQVYPNPVSEKLNLVVSSPASGKGQICINDLSGRRLLTTTTSLATGDNVVSINTSALSAGTYIITIHADDGQKPEVARFVKQ